MKTENSKGENLLDHELNLICVVCGFPLYSTDGCSRETTYHCSSKEARFWEYERGTRELLKAKEHWDKSKKEIFNGN
ncbi:MAG TPA: hypothetical protein DIC22_02340 [Chitinophagaceae bacterium]|jgi:hypothetical protein|nr:hypothetical protein [Chitinophagaceae bacterium]